MNRYEAITKSAFNQSREAFGSAAGKTTCEDERQRNSVLAGMEGEATKCSTQGRGRGLPPQRPAECVAL
jgi:hypothetical protein